jgi:hypothetical protein
VLCLTPVKLPIDDVNKCPCLHEWSVTPSVLVCSIHRCPSCEALIEKLPPSAAPGQCSCRATSSSASTRCRCEHKQQHRLRCAACGNAFCDACRSVPYHEGLDCREAAAPHCPLCDALVLEALDLQVCGSVWERIT